MLQKFIRGKGFAIPAHDIYGSNQGLWDFGPLGVLMKEKISKEWWKSIYSLAKTHPALFPTKISRVLPIQTSLLVSQPLLKASGHIENFYDSITECALTGNLTRVDHLEEFRFNISPTDCQNIRFNVKIPDPMRFLGRDEDKEKTIDRLAHCTGFEDLRILKIKKDSIQFEMKRPLWIDRIKSAKSNNSPFLGKPRAQQLMFEFATGSRDAKAVIPSDISNVGLNHPCYQAENLSSSSSSSSSSSLPSSLFLRPETTQGVMAQFKELSTIFNLQTPFILAQEGKAFRNEIGCSPIRTKEFEQMEAFLFCKTLEESHAFAHGLSAVRLEWWKSLMARRGKGSDLRLLNQKKEDLAHYALSCQDIEIKDGESWMELEGIANRGQYDLKNHYPHESDLPFVVECSMGLSRSLMALLSDAYVEGTKERSSYLSLHPKLAPISLAILPIVETNEKIVFRARQLYEEAMDDETILPNVQYDEGKSIGRRYCRQDSIGTPFCITVDEQTVSGDGTVTIRERDSRLQVRVPIRESLSLVKQLIRADDDAVKKSFFIVTGAGLGKAQRGNKSLFTIQD